MPKAKSHIPEGLSAVTPQLVTKDARAVAAFAEKAFGAKLEHAMPGPDGKGVMHGMLRIGAAVVFVSDVPGFAQHTQANLFVYVPDVDASYASALAAGAKALQPVTDMFWGDRWGMVADPWGTVWQIATHKETISPEEMMSRMQSASKG
jgi:uncharacterized glyoxalase superfamily protein PhnB